MVTEETIKKAKYYNAKGVWLFSEMQECENFRNTLKFDDESDLDFDVMDFWYDGMLSQILLDAKDVARREGYYKGYVWGKRYLENFIGWDSLISSELYPAICSSQAYEMLLEKLVSECIAGEKQKRQSRKNK